jgi:serine/threonine-protein kinase HipA
MIKLDVLFCGWGEQWQLGTLADNGSVLLFEYAPAALRRGLELSPRHLKLQAAAYGDFAPHQWRLPGLIADALPDGWGMLPLDRLFRKNGRAPTRLSPLERLAFIADRAMGALVFAPADALAQPSAELDLRALGHAAQAIGYGKDRDSELLQQLALLGGASHGARPRLQLQFDPASGQLGALPGDAGTPWLFKLPAHGEHKEVCAVEHVYAELARACGLDVPATCHFDLDRRLAAFGVERHDRSDGMRVPVHTLAGLLHADFRRAQLDYGIYLRVTRMMTRDESQVRAAFERCVFNVLFHHRDDHARSFSFRMDQRWQWRLAPCHDLGFSLGPGGEHQMAVMGERREPAAADLLRLALDAALDPVWAGRVVERMADLGGRFVQLAKTAPIRAATVKAIARIIEDNRLRLARPA